MRELKYNQKAFSIIEVIIAISVITFSLLGIVSLSTQNIKSENYSSNYLIASMLAQEGLELVRNRRDENWLTTGIEWYDQISDGNVGTLDSFAIDTDNPIDPSADSFADSQTDLYFNGTIYTHTPGVKKTIFKRIIEVDDSKLISSNLIMMTVKIQWKVRGKTFNYNIESHLYNWREVGM